MKYCHVCIACKDWQLISKFYQDVFGCIPLDPIRNMKGSWPGKLIAAPVEEEAEIIGEHIMVPGYGDEGPTLEILTYKPYGKDVTLECYDPGFTHVCFEVPTQEEKNAAIEKLLACGGSMISKFDDYHVERAVYARDPEGNIVEIRIPNAVPDTIRYPK